MHGCTYLRPANSKVAAPKQYFSQYIFKIRRGYNYGKGFSFSAVLKELVNLNSLLNHSANELIFVMFLGLGPKVPRVWEVPGDWRLRHIGRGFFLDSGCVWGHRTEGIERRRRWVSGSTASG